MFQNPGDRGGRQSFADGQGGLVYLTSGASVLGTTAFLDFQRNNVSKVQLRMNGSVAVTPTTASGPFSQSEWLLQKADVSATGIVSVNGNDTSMLGFWAGGSNSPLAIRTISSTSYVWVGSTTQLGFGSTGSAYSSLPDVILWRAAAASLQLGAADAASPVAQTLRVQSVSTGTSNTAGVDWTLQGSRGTGTGAGGKIIFQTAPAGSTGSTQGTYTTALTIQSDQGVVAASYVKTLSTTVASLPSASTAGSGARAFVTDASATTFLSTVTGGGANKVPVVSDGSVWLIG
jgi:hypothetical protein